MPAPHRQTAELGGLAEAGKDDAMAPRHEGFYLTPVPVPFCF